MTRFTLETSGGGFGNIFVGFDFRFLVFLRESLGAGV